MPLIHASRRSLLRYDYITALGPIGADYPWVTAGTVVVVDVGKALTLVATGARDGCSLAWTVDSGRVHHASDDPAVWMGKFSEVGVYPASVTETCPGSGGLHGPGTLVDDAAVGEDGLPFERTTNGYVVATYVETLEPL